MDTKPALQNIQDGFLNIARREKSAVTICLLYGAELTGRIRSFDKFSLILESDSQELLIFKHAISTIQYARQVNGDVGDGKDLIVSGEFRQPLPDGSQAVDGSADITEQVDS